MMEIQTGVPITDGLYAVYTDSPLLLEYTERKMLMWFQGEWFYPMSDQKHRGKVYGWIALPVMKKERFFHMSSVEDWAKPGDPLVEYDL